MRIKNWMKNDSKNEEEKRKKMMRMMSVIFLLCDPIPCVWREHQFDHPHSPSLIFSLNFLSELVSQILYFFFSISFSLCYLFNRWVNCFLIIDSLIKFPLPLNHSLFWDTEKSLYTQKEKRERERRSRDTVTQKIDQKEREKNSWSISSMCEVCLSSSSAQHT